MPPLSLCQQGVDAEVVSFLSIIQLLVMTLVTGAEKCDIINIISELMLFFLILLFLKWLFKKFQVAWPLY